MGGQGRYKNGEDGSILVWYDRKLGYKHFGAKEKDAWEEGGGHEVRRSTGAHLVM